MLAAGSAVVAALALIRAISTHRRLTALSETYWELRYDFARLRARLAKLDGEQAAADPEDSAAGGTTSD